MPQIPSQKAVDTVEPKNSSPYVQQLAIGLYPEPAAAIHSLVPHFLSPITAYINAVYQNAQVCG